MANCIDINIGKIAASGRPTALDLIREILLASAAVPGAFPPVMIDVEADGRRYQEMHVDGGASAQVFIYPPSLQLQGLSRAVGIERERRLYILRNARLDPNWVQVNRRTLTIAGRAISSLIQTQGIGDLYRVYVAARRDGIDFNLASIPPSFTTELKTPFDSSYMKALYQVGFDLGRRGYQWVKYPPEYRDLGVGPTLRPVSSVPEDRLAAAQFPSFGRIRGALRGLNDTRRVIGPPFNINQEISVDRHRDQGLYDPSMRARRQIDSTNTGDNKAYLISKENLRCPRQSGSARYLRQYSAAP